MELSAIFHHPDKRFCYALAPGQFLLRIQAKANDLRRVVLHTMDKYLPLSIADTRQQQVMEKVTTDGVHDYFEARISLDMVCLRYFFALTDHHGKTVYYGNYRFFPEEIRNIDDMFDCPQTLREEERFCIPDWAANKVVYQIFPTRFASSRPVPDRIWYQTPMGPGADLKGDLRGILSRLPYLRDLGVDVLYLTPIFQANSCHKYDTVDYFQVDSRLGTEEDLRQLVQQAHAMGMRIILDAVFNHTSRDFFAFRDILEKGETSPYCSWYYIRSFPIRAERGEKPTYKTFSYYGGMPKLNLQNPQVQEYVFQVVRYWMRACQIDGWRLDVGDEISHSFWKAFRKVVKAENPQALIVGEVWHYAGDFLEGDEWDTMMNYDFQSAVLGFVHGGPQAATQFVQRMGFLRGNAHTHVYPVLWNLIDSHDTQRAMRSCGDNPDRFRLAAAMQLLSTGMPMIYYGDEYGLTGGNDPDCRRGMPWKPEKQNGDIFRWYQTLIRLRKAHPVITQGRITAVYADDQKGILAITREAEEEKMTLVFYNGSEPAACGIPQGRDLITGALFRGTLSPFQVLILSPADDST